MELALVVLWGTDSEGSRARRAAGLGVPRQGGPLASRSTLSEGVFLVYKEPGRRGLVRF